ncbi:hypothetical protein E2C01_036052 [Portunus trituberculatus]|uniref:Uncharacterized protein n=1 Tax=Portunus trituberculatus TaxID=210409 RepID=A0A5B7F4T0_PORTR|nr:hypothetical protein [Portunus trituberculatus]
MEGNSFPEEVSGEGEARRGACGSYRQSSHHNRKIKERRLGKEGGEEDAARRAKIYGEGRG